MYDNPLRQVIPRKPGTMIHVGHYNQFKDRMDEKNVVYIGRAMPRYKLKASPLANPLKEKLYPDVWECISEYAKIIRYELSDLLVNNVGMEIDRLKCIYEKHGELFLICWCKKVMDDDTPCHGDVIRDILKEME